jgi:hypothetical protein
MLYFSFALQMFERSAIIENNPFIYYENSIWFISMTVTAVGFGDFNIYTHQGMFIVSLASFWSSVNTSAIIVVLVNTLTLNSL